MLPGLESWDGEARCAPSASSGSGCGEGDGKGERDAKLKQTHRQTIPNSAASMIVSAVIV